MANIKNYSNIDINKSVNIEIIKAVEENNQISVDELITKIGPFYTLMDWGIEPTPERGTLKYAIRYFVNSHNKIKFSTLSRESIENLLQSEWLGNLTDEMKANLLLSINLIQGFDADGKIVLNEKIYGAYKRIMENPTTVIPFGNKDYSENHTRGVLISFDGQKYKGGFLELLEYYKLLLDSGISNAIADEIYKWNYIEQCKNKSVEEVIQTILSFPTKDFNLNSWQDTDYLKQLWSMHRQETVAAVALLLKGDGTLSDRYWDFKTFVNGKGLKTSERMASVILTCLDPVKYGFYMNGYYLSLCRYLKISDYGAGEAYEHYLKIVESLQQLIEKDEEFMQSMNKRIGIEASTLSLAQNIIFVIFYKRKQMFLNWVMSKQ